LLFKFPKQIKICVKDCSENPFARSFAKDCNEKPDPQGNAQIILPILLKAKVFKTL